jgi:hypothetical protein
VGKAEEFSLIKRKTGAGSVGLLFLKGGRNRRFG